MNNLIIISAILATSSLLVWAIWALAVLPERPDFAELPIWRPKHPTLVLLALLLGLAGFYVRYHFPDPEKIDNWLWSFIIDLAPEMVGMAFTIVVIDELNQRRLEQQEKENLIRQMRSDSNPFALEALRQIREKGWLYRGDLCGQLFRHANLQKAHLESADLQEADFTGANLQYSSLVRANLQRARLKVAHLQGAELHHANLQGAILENADLREVMLYDTNLQGANLHGAYLQAANLSHANLKDTDLSWANYSDDTVWPQGFNPKAAKAIKTRWDEEAKRWTPDNK